MKIIIDIPEEIYKRVVKAPRCATFFDAFTDRDIFCKALKNGTPVPKGVCTNGDIIQIMFPNAKWWLNEDNQIFSEDFNCQRGFLYFDLNWWNSPYKAERSENTED